MGFGRAQGPAQAASPVSIEHRCGHRIHSYVYTLVPSASAPFRLDATARYRAVRRARVAQIRPDERGHDAGTGTLTPGGRRARPIRVGGCGANPAAGV